MNLIAFHGRLTRDPELRTTASGKNVTNFSVAINEGQETTFMNVTAWGKLADTVKEYCSKGKEVIVQGRVKQENWEKDGNKQSRLITVADRVQFLGSKKADDAENGVAEVVETADGVPF